jgi:Fis family transcriptional regulator
VLQEVEAPLLREVLAWSRGNQSKAAAALGINRATLRKKLAIHSLD